MDQWIAWNVMYHTILLSLSADSSLIANAEQCYGTILPVRIQQDYGISRTRYATIMTPPYTFMTFPYNSLEDFK